MERIIEELTENQREILSAYQSEEERLSFIDSEGLELTDEQMAKISGGDNNAG